MKYVALLRGINVGGKNLVKMADLTLCLEGNGFKSVTTYIQSGNIIFESEVRDTATLTRSMAAALSMAFRYELPIVLRSRDELKAVVAQVPKEWKRGTGLRCYVAFLREPLTAKQALNDFNPREGVDSVLPGKGVIYMTTPISRLKQSGFTKLVGKPIYQEMTIRNYNTCQKILALMQSK